MNGDLFDACVVSPQREPHSSYDSFLQAIINGFRSQQITVSYAALTDSLAKHPDFLTNCTEERMTAPVSAIFCIEEALGVRVCIYDSDGGQLYGPAIEAAPLTTFRLLEVEGFYYFMDDMDIHDPTILSFDPRDPSMIHN